MKIKDVIVEQGVGQELWRRATMRPEQKRELEQMESMLVKLTKLPLEQVQKNSKDILKQYKELLNRNDDWQKDPVGREIALAKAIQPYYPDTAEQIITAYSGEKKEINKAQQQPSAAAPAQQPASAAQTTAPVQQGYRTAVIVPTAAGDRRFWYDGKNWREHFGQDWPRDLQTSQVVSDPNTVQFLAKQVQLKNTQQIPYGQRPKNKTKS